MIRSEELDRESYQDIVNHAITSIPGIMPEWTNYNESEPGIMLTELLAYYTEVQQYHLNVLHRGHYQRYLKLLGERCMPVTPSRTYLQISGSGWLEKRAVFYADTIPFETEYGFHVQDNLITSICSGKTDMENHDILLSSEQTKYVFYPFDAENKEFYIYLKNKPVCKDFISIYFEIQPMENCAQITDDFIEYIRFHVQVNGSAADRGAEVVADNTKGFARSGTIVIRISENIEPDEKGYGIHFVIDEGDYPVYPVFTNVLLNVVPAVQTYSYAECQIYTYEQLSNMIMGRKIDALYGVDGERRIFETDWKESGGRIQFSKKSFDRYEAHFYKGECKDAEKRYLGEAYGLCNYRIKYDRPDCMEESMKLYVLEESGLYAWERVDDFDASTKYSRHFVYDALKCEFLFGDGENGMPPEGKIYLVGCKTTLGVLGNVKNGMVNSYIDLTGLHGVNILPSKGGNYQEKYDDSFLRIRQSLSSLDCCITLRDYEEAVRKTPGVPIRRIHAYLSEENDNWINIAVECPGQEKQFNEGCLKNLKQYIEPRKMVGTKVEFIVPQYTGIHIYLDMTTNLYYSNIRVMTEEAIRKYFDSDRVGFGDVISHSRLSKYIYSLEWVESIKSLEISVHGNRARVLGNKDIQLMNQCLPYVEQIHIGIRNS